MLYKNETRRRFTYVSSHRHPKLAFILKNVRFNSAYCGQHNISVVVDLMIQGRRQQRKDATSLKMFFPFSSRLFKLTLSICSRSYFYGSKFRKRKKILCGLDDVQNVKWVTTAVRRGHQNACVRDMAIIACVFCRNLHLTIWFLVFDK